MDRRYFVSSCVRGAGALGASMVNIGRCKLFGSTREYPTRVLDIVGRSLVIDMLGLVTLNWDKLSRWHEDPSSFSSSDMQVLQDSGVNVFHPAVNLDSGDLQSAARRCMKSWNSFVERRSDDFLRIVGSADLLRAKASGRAGILLGMQNSAHFQTVTDVAEFHSLGQRVSQLTYNSSNAIGTGCLERHDRGLTEFGSEIVRAMNQTGMIIDISHAGDRTSLDAIKLSSKPVLITHANCRALMPHPRCKSDVAIRAMAKRGGIMGITALPLFYRNGQNAGLKDALDHFDHVARIAGVEHVGLGSDTDVAASPTGLRGLDHPRRVFDLAGGLLRRGYSEADVELILGGNFHRVMRELFD